MKFKFRLEAGDKVVIPSGKARAGCLFFEDQTEIKTPVFMPVGTRASVKSISPAELSGMGYRLILGNSYHLYLRPGKEIIAELGGLGRFMSWPYRTLTDSGGFQAFSLSGLVQHDSQGIVFSSHLDGSRHRFDPEKVIDIQHGLASDIVMPLDDCAPYPADKQRIEASLQRTHDWFHASYNYFHEKGYSKEQNLFPILQGGVSSDMRLKSSETLIKYDVEGFAIGGLSVGESRNELVTALRASLREIPADKPRYLMGVGAISDILIAVENGVDMFDCVLPTRNARNGQLFTSEGKLNIRNEKHARSELPIDENCSCTTCLSYSRAYLRHLHKSKELLVYGLLTCHNLFFMYRFMAELRDSIVNQSFSAFKAKWDDVFSGH